MEKLNIDLSSLIRNSGYEDAEEFRSIWKKAVDRDESEHSAAVSFKEGKLTVNVDNSVYLQNLLLKRLDILRRMNEISPDKKVDEVRFKLGSAG